MCLTEQDILDHLMDNAGTMNTWNEWQWSSKSDSVICFVTCDKGKFSSVLNNVVSLTRVLIVL